jgi:xylulokinase
MDRRGIPYLEPWRQSTPLPIYYEITGLPIYYISSLSKILWFKDKASSLFTSAAHIWPIASLIAARMGVVNPPIDHATASFYGLMDTRERIWSNSISQVLGLDQEKLPELVPPGTIIGRLSNPQAAVQLGLPLGLPLVIGGGDQQCAALGSGMIHLGHSLINLGTATALMASVNQAVRDPNHIIPCVCHAAPGYWEMEGHTQASGVILQRFRDELGAIENQLAQQSGRDIYDLLTEQASRSRPGSSGLLFLPMFNGSTAPVDEPHGAGTLIGLRLSHTRADLLRAILEGICLENRWILETMQHSGARIEKISLTGGASKSAFWNQLHADILKSPITQVKTSNAALIGAAICAGLGVKVFANVEEAVGVFSQSGATYLPNQDTAAVYDHLYEQFISAYSRLCASGVYKELRLLAE